MVTYRQIGFGCLGLLVVMGLCALLSVGAFYAAPKAQALVASWQSPAKAATPDNGKSAKAEDPKSGNPSNPQGGNATSGSVTCPTDGEMQSALGLKTSGIKAVFTGGGVPWEGCSWVVQAVGIGSFDLNLTADWEATVTRAADDVVAVYYGPVGVKVKGGTLRFRPFYNTADNKWVNDSCVLLQREDEFGHGRNPSYHTVSGNVPCSSFAHPMGQSNSTQPAPSNGSTVKAKFATSQDVASAVGGKAEKWTRPEPKDFPNTWKYLDKGNLVQLRNPGGVSIDYWNGGVATSTTAGNLPVKVDEATLKVQ